MYRLRQWITACLVVPVVGCGGQSAQPASPNEQAKISGSAPVEVAPELSVASAPQDLIAVGRFRESEKSIQTILNWANIPIRPLDELPAEAKPLRNIIAWEAPIDVAVALDPDAEERTPKPLFVVSIGINSVDEALAFARKQGKNFERVGPGIYRTPSDSEDVHCAIAAARGAARSRLVCGRLAKAVDLLLPYATRGLPDENLGKGELEIKLFAEPFQRRYTGDLAALRVLLGVLLREVELKNARFDRAVSDATYALADELTQVFTDLERIEISASIDRQKSELNLVASASFKAQNSWVAQTLPELAKRSAPAPELFWRLPVDSGSASFVSATLPEERFRKMDQMLRGIADAYLDSQKYSADLREKAQRIISAVLVRTNRVVGAMGRVANVEPGAKAVKDEHPGWGVFVLDPKTPGENFVSDVADLLNSKEVKRALGANNKAPKLLTRPLKIPGFSNTGKLFEITFAANTFAEFAPKGHEQHYLEHFYVGSIVDAEKTWIGFSVDEKVLVARLRGVHDGTVSPLSQRAGLERLKSDLQGGGFLTLGTYAEPYINTAQLPHHGEVALPFTRRVTDKATFFTLAVPKAAIEDIGVAAAQHGR